MSVNFFFPQVTKMLGNGRLEAMCFDGTKRLCHIRLVNTIYISISGRLEAMCFDGTKRLCHIRLIT